MQAVNQKIGDQTMDAVTVLPNLQALPDSWPNEGAVRVELVEGVLVFKVSQAVQGRIEELLWQQQETPLSAEEERELDCYEEMDDYLSLVNRTIRNLALQQSQQVS
jgi:hypothetical protein